MTKIYLYPVWLRLWHACNALLFLILIATGISMQYSGENFVMIPFQWSVTLHNIAGIGIFAAYLMFLIFNIKTGNQKQYGFSLNGMGKQIRFYTIGVFKGEPHPFHTTANRKFNPLQQITYSAVMWIIVPVLLLTGLPLMFPELIVDNFFGIGGTLITSLLHAVAGFMLSIFLLIHLYFATMGTTPLANYKSMATGYHQMHE